MAEAIVQPIPSSTTVTEDLTSFVSETNSFIRRNQDVVVVVVAIGVALLLGRTIIRRELKHIKFNINLPDSFPEELADIVDNHYTRASGM